MEWLYIQQLRKVPIKSPYVTIMPEYASDCLNIVQAWTWQNIAEWP